jgi:hypothetical protein
MLKKLITLSLMLVFASGLLLAQSTHVLKANGDLVKLKKGGDLQEALSVSKFKRADGQIAKNVVLKATANPQATPDTLSYVTEDWNTNFGFFSGNVMMQYFVAPADLTIKGAGFSCSDETGSATADVSVRLLKLNYTYEQLLGIEQNSDFGYYESENDGLGGIDPFGEAATSNWISSNPDYPIPPWADNVDPNANTFDYDLWSDGGFGWPITAELQAAEANYQWVDMALLGFEPTVLAGEVFAVAVTHDGTDAGFADDRIGLFATEKNIPGWKYYEEGLIQESWDGWAVRSYTWDMAVAVELTGDRAPVINSFDQLATSLETGPRTVTANITDDNPSGGNAGVASATLSYSLDEGANWTDIAMTGTEPDFSATIPGQVPGTSIWYKINAVDVEGLAALEAGPHNYRVFEQVNSRALLVFNGLTGDSGYPQDYYFAVDWTHDVWAFGALTEELVSFYDNIIEIATAGPGADNSDVVRAWLEADGTRNYMLAGDEWLGGVAYGWPSPWTPITTAEGDFARDILGVDVYYADLVTNNLDVTPVFAIEGSALGGALYDAYTQRQADSGFTGPILYDPNYEIGEANWLDGVDFLADVEVDMHGLDTAHVDGEPVERPIAGHRVLPAGNKIAFFAFDPLSLNQGGDEYNWWSYTSVAPQYAVLDWFGDLVGLKELNNNVPDKYNLSQNYPNPFNPSTSINFSIPKSGLTTLKLYNVLGQEVATIMNKELTAGSYSVDFDARDLSSGMYIYTISSGDFEISKKMMLLK